VWAVKNVRLIFFVAHTMAIILFEAKKNKNVVTGTINFANGCNSIISMKKHLDAATTEYNDRSSKA
jgi:hypothetical protein